MALHALNIFRKQHNFKYIILGKAQPQYSYGIQYQNYIEKVIEELDLKDHVIWIKQYLSTQELINYISAADIGLVTYTENDQASSGVTPIILSLGRPVIATPFAYTTRIASKIHGIHLSKSLAPIDVYDELTKLTDNKKTLQQEMFASHSDMEPYHWNHIGMKYEQVFVNVLANTNKKIAHAGDTIPSFSKITVTPTADQSSAKVRFSGQ